MDEEYAVVKRSAILSLISYNISLLSSKGISVWETKDLVMQVV